MKQIFILMDANEHGANAIINVYDTFDKAIDDVAWDTFGDTPDVNGKGNDLFIHKMTVN